MTFNPLHLPFWLVVLLVITLEVCIIGLVLSALSALVDWWTNRQSVKDQQQHYLTFVSRCQQYKAAWPETEQLVRQWKQEDEGKYRWRR